MGECVSQYLGMDVSVGTCAGWKEWPLKDKILRSVLGSSSTMDCFPAFCSGGSPRLPIPDFHRSLVQSWPTFSLSFSIFFTLQATSVQGRMVVSQSGDLMTVPNVEAILEDFAILGKGLVQTVEARSEKWTV